MIVTVKQDKQFFVFQSHTSKFAKESTEKVLKRIIYENGKGVSRKRLIQVHVECFTNTITVT